MRVAPLSDSRLNQSATDHLRLLSDLSESERKINDKNNRNEPLSPEEQQMLTSINKKLESKIEDEDFMKTVTEQLNNQVSFVDFKVKDSLKVLV